MSDRHHVFLQKAALCGVFACFAAITGLLEGLCGIDAFFPVPGVKLGLANLFVMAAFALYGVRVAFSVSLVRLALVFLFSGNLTSLLLSLAGGTLALLGQCAFMPFYGKRCTFIGVSAVSSACHGFGQLVMAYFLVRTPIFWYLPFLVGLSVVCGCIVGALLDRLLALLPQEVQRRSRYAPVFARPAPARAPEERKND